MTGTRESSPVRLRRRLRHRLRELRGQSGLKQTQAAERLGWSESKILRIEGGLVGVSTLDLKQMLELYQVRDPAVIEELASWAKAGRRQPWSRYRDVHGDAFRRYLGYESAAVWLREFQSHFVPGLLQTREYAEALLTQAPVRPPSAYTRERIIQARHERQQILDDPECPAIEIILDEALIRRPIGDQAIMAGQLENLLLRARHPHVTLRILPSNAGAFAGLGTSFVILGFDDTGDSVLYCEGQSGETTTLSGNGNDDPVADWARAFDQMRDRAATPAASLEMIRTELARLDGGML